LDFRLTEDLINIESFKIEVTDKGLTKISEKGSTIRCAIFWKDEQAFKDFIVNRLIKWKKILLLLYLKIILLLYKYAVIDTLICLNTL